MSKSYLYFFEAVPSLPAELYKSCKKEVTAKTTEFSAQLHQSLETNPAKVRQSQVVDIPGALLGLDYHMETEIEKYLNQTSAKESVGAGDPMKDFESLSPLQMLERDVLTKEYLERIYCKLALVDVVVVSCFFGGEFWGAWLNRGVFGFCLTRLGEMGESRAEKDKNAKRVSGVTFQGFARGASYGGVIPGGFPSATYQLSGARLICVVDLAELSEVYLKNVKDGKHCLTDCSLLGIGFGAGAVPGTLSI